VAREVGTEGKLGGQAQVPASPARGGSPTTRQPARRQPDDAGPQHRQVTTAVAPGDLSRKITVDAKGGILG
jgi:hypothetical protein